jgi:toxin ParE1/3/4
LSRVFTVLRPAAAGLDLSLIFDHLAYSYIALGDDVATALERAANRVRAIDAAMEQLGRAPFQGTLCEELMPGTAAGDQELGDFLFSHGRGAGVC